MCSDQLRVFFYAVDDYWGNHVQLQLRDTNRDWVDGASGVMLEFCAMI